MTGTGERSAAALAADVKAITDRVHEMLWADWDEHGTTGGPTVTIHLKMSAAWLPLMAWMQLVERGRRQGRAGPPSVSVLDLNERYLRRQALRWLRAQVEDQMHCHLHDLCLGNHPLLLPLLAEPDRPADDRPDADDVPF
ncbi:hypothetical protein [Novosphingobium sp. KN65.2]|uniref:hypothetical protein n=1 Tax=Novosphingobium sp. KN65.2 TaxID=1478134 RepID=UPI0005E8EB32|nr:hypothetical protein [Novosphingobium sp. KN65.2]CDO38867.1 hypothetical protein SPHV1_80016 [Novosphingobium sp. KN65.2]